jgi:hypothetical protein
VFLPRYVFTYAVEARKAPSPFARRPRERGEHPPQGGFGRSIAAAAAGISSKSAFGSHRARFSFSQPDADQSSIRATPAFFPGEVDIIWRRASNGASAESGFRPVEKAPRSVTGFRCKPAERHHARSAGDARRDTRSDTRSEARRRRSAAHQVIHSADRAAPRGRTAERAMAPAMGRAQALGQNRLDRSL